MNINEKKQFIRNRVNELQKEASPRLPVKVTFVSCIRKDRGISGTTYRVVKHNGKRWVPQNWEIQFTNQHVRTNSPEELRMGVAHEMAHVRTAKPGQTTKEGHGPEFRRVCKKFGGGNRCGRFI
jgi:predicted metal-dependent hydrolase